jgi:hypothetical protein
MSTDGRMGTQLDSVMDLRHYVDATEAIRKGGAMARLGKKKNVKPHLILSPRGLVRLFQAITLMGRTSCG